MSVKIDMCPAPDVLFKCDTCGLENPGSCLVPIKDFFQRVDIGGETPGGECPSCGALCYLAKNPRLPILVMSSSINDLHPKAQEVYAVDAWGEHAQFDRDEWESEIRQSDTQLGYWEWLSHRLESVDDDKKRNK